MKVLAKQIERELKRKIGHCAIYEEELQRIWPLSEKDRKAKIEQFAKEYGFKLRHYKQGLCAIFQKDPPRKRQQRDQSGGFVRYTIRMRDRRFSQQIQKMLDVVLCLPGHAWEFVLIDVNKKIGTAALQKIILRACDESDSPMFERFKRSIVLFKKRSGERRK